ncbi:MAG: UDP-glucose/GDP-mannose dehydrogenase family protein [Rhizobiales bacterium]|nr:UDP-glucose/GDP-mannose dehydrogenase family protein [Hyphomicrobiales bacterium]
MNALNKAQDLDSSNAYNLAVTKPSISVIGLGYVGAVSTACLANLGHRIIGVDIDTIKTKQISKGESPIHEQGLGELLSKGVAENLITATCDVARAVSQTDITFVSVGTPTSEDGGCDYKYIISAARAIGEGIAQKSSYHVVVMRCSIPPSTTLNVMVPEIEAASGLKMGVDFGVCFNPEFLREGTAIADFKDPPKTVIGANDEKAAKMLADIYSPVDDNVIMTSIEVAEMVKYVDNVWHATKVCFGNEVGRICKPLNIDSHKVMDIFVQDTKLNLSPYYLKPGFAYGGSCLPKEVRAVVHLAKNLGLETPLISSLSKTNEQQIESAIQLVRQTGKKKIGFLGLAFKAGTDDLRESPALEMMNTLIEEGYDVSAYDPAIKKDTRIDNQFSYMRHACPHLEPVVNALPNLLRNQGQQVSKECDVIVVTQKTPEIQNLIAGRLGHVEVIDLVRLFKNQPNFKGYQGIGW